MNGASVSPACDYCGLPLGGTLSPPEHSPNDGSDAAQYCCFGCRFASSITADSGESGEARWMLTRLGVAIFFAMNVMVFTLALWSRDIYADQPSVGSETADVLYELLRYACLMFTAPVVLLLGGPILEQAWQNLRRREITTDWLLATGVVAALVYSAISVWTGGKHIYFEVACMVLVAVTLGRWLEATGKLKTTQTIRSLQRLLPEAARVVQSQGPCEVPLDQVNVGDVIRVLAGERIPLDGRIVQGRASIDQQMLSGESEPVTRTVTDHVLAGSLNLDGDLLIEVTELARTGTLQRLVDLVTHAVQSKGVEQRLADRLSRGFVPVIAALTLSSFAYYWAQSTFHEALMTSLSVVLIACPCALAIATPLAVWAALGTACHHQVLFRGGDALSALSRVQVVAFDKTGTLTMGRAEVERLQLDQLTDPADFARRTKTLASGSNHVLSHAIDRFLHATHSPCQESLEVVPGRGIRGTLAHDEGATHLGSLTFMQAEGLDVPPELESVIQTCRDEAKSFCCVGWNEQVRGVFVFRETIRPEAAEAVDKLRSMGIQVQLLTGDHHQRAANFARSLGIEVKSDLLPAEKLAAIHELRRTYAGVAMVGDGINDAPALAAADVGIAMGCGADVSREAADVCLLMDDLNRLPWAIQWARETRRTVRQNLFWAFAYNSVGVSLAMAQLLNPMVAAIAMVGSSLFVVSNSLRLATDDRPFVSAAPRDATAAQRDDSVMADSSERVQQIPMAPTPEVSNA